jgi:hypothetical protein
MARMLDIDMAKSIVHVAREHAAATVRLESLMFHDNGVSDEEYIQIVEEYIRSWQAFKLVIETLGRMTLV